MPWFSNECKPVISYDGTSINFSGVETDEVIRFKIGDFKINRDLLQAATDSAKIFDLYRMSNCEKIKQLSKKSRFRDNFILETMKSEERLLEFLMMLNLAASNPSQAIEKALADWIAYASTRSIREQAPIITEKVRAGQLVREQPPVEEYNSLKRSVAKARNSSELLKDSLENPQFDINDVYSLV